MCFLKELGKLDCAFQAILNRNLMKHVKIYKSASVKWLRLNQKFFSVPNGYLEGIWLIWPTGVSVLHVSLFGSPRLKEYMRQFNLKTFNCFESNDHYSGSVAYASNWILYGKNLRDQNPWRLDLTLKLHLSRLWTGHSKPSQPNPGSTLKFYRNNSNPVDVMIPFDCDDRCSFFFPQHSEGLGVGDLIWRKPGIRLGGTPSLDVTSEESSRRHCLAFWGGVQFTHVTDSINFKQKDVVFTSKKKHADLFFEKIGPVPLP